MNEIEIYFNKAGNTIIGDYARYTNFDRAMSAKNVFLPHSYSIRCAISDFERLVEHVQLFGHCIKALAGFNSACELAGIKLRKD